MRKNLILIGAGGHCRSVLDATTDDFCDVVVFDAAQNGQDFCGRPLYRGRPAVADYPTQDWAIHVAIGNNAMRENLSYQFLDQGYCLATLIHPSAIISPNAQIADGVAILPGAIVNAGAKIGRGAIINSRAVVEHDCTIEDFAHLSTGAVTTGGCHVGPRSWIGAGAVLRQSVTICSDVVIGAGGVVLNPITKPGTYVGVPVKQKTK